MRCGNKIGVGIQCPPNATIVFKQEGILEEIREHAVEPQERIMRSYHGAIGLTQRIGSLIKDAYRVPYLLVQVSWHLSTASPGAQHDSQIHVWDGRRAGTARTRSQTFAG
ncbi:hypothetical protein HO173_007278 [Letharia columbiana]|uniref:Uncharacterized protein n=1 Tax=Letharia columbiana TaxID=112416 RepID=A0A8H6FTT7_9LECA|nr:uncharacterized protein HO173_007278 [Letharia columbiana]KAF6234652.1 hypothetical protein HO173_007278 [Letharia columbiana]